VAVADAREKALEIPLRPVPLAGPHPQTAVAAPSALMLGRVGLGRVGVVQVAVDHLHEHLATRLLVTAPQVVRVAPPIPLDTP